MNKKNLKDTALAQVKKKISNSLEKINDSVNAVKPQIYKLEMEDNILLENLMLKQQVNKMSITLAEMSAKEAQDNFQNHLIAKFKIDMTKFQIHINTVDKTVTLLPRE